MIMPDEIGTHSAGASATANLVHPATATASAATLPAADLCLGQPALPQPLRPSPPPALPHASTSARLSTQLHACPAVRCLIKLGGAAITDKAGAPDSPRLSVIQELALQLAAGLQRTPAVIVHGAGSCGHPQASRHGVAGGPLSDPHVSQGFVLTRASVTKLNHLVVDALVQAGLPACALSPCGAWRTSSRQVVQDGVDQVAGLLRAGLLPVLHGDAVLDDVLGCTILSGDTLLLHLASALRPDFCVFLTNVAGVFDRPPDQPGACLLRHITVLPDGRWSAEGADGPIQLTSSPGDVTGGIALKVQEAARIAVLGIPVLIAEAGTADGALACSQGLQLVQDLTATHGISPWRGTLVTLK